MKLQKVIVLKKNDSRLKNPSFLTILCFLNQFKVEQIKVRFELGTIEIWTTQISILY